MPPGTFLSPMERAAWGGDEPRVSLLLPRNVLEEKSPGEGTQRL